MESSKREYSFFRRSPESISDTASKPEYHFFKPEETRERPKNTAGILSGSTLAAVGAVGLGAGVLLGEVLKRAMKVDFDAHGINAANEDATKMFSKGYDWAYGKKKAA